MEFEKAAFGLSENGQYSKPVLTQYGWHIIKRLDKKPVKTFEEMKNELKTKVARSDRADKSRTVVLARIKKEYGFQEKANNLAYFYELCDSAELIEGKWKIPAKAKLKKLMFKFAGRKYIQSEFADYIVEKMVPRKGGDHKPLINYMYEQWVEEILTEYEKSKLGEKYPDYNRLLKEYRDGIILFERTEAMVWTKAVKDTAGLRAYHSAHDTTWMWQDRMVGTVYICSDSAVAVATKKLLDAGKGDVVILEQLNKKSVLKVRVEEGVYEVNGRPEVAAVEVKEGISEIKKVGEVYVVLKVKEILPAAPKALEDIKGLVTAAYQDYLMETWLKDLAAKYNVVYNEAVFEQLIK